MNCEEEEWSDVSDHEESAPVPSCAASKRPVMPTFTGFGAGNAGAHNRVTAPMPAPASDELAGFGAPQPAPPTAAPVTVEAATEPKADSKLSSMRGRKPVQSSSDDDVEPVAGTVAKEKEEEQQEKKDEKPKLSMRGRAPVQSSSDDDDEEAATPAATASTTKVEAPKPEKKEVAKEKAAPLSQDEIAKLSDDDSIWRCVKCCKPKDLRGKHLDGKTEVRSDCWPCARKTLFKRNRRKQGEVVGPAQGGGAGDAAATAVAPSTDSTAAPTTGVAAPTPSTFASGFKSAPVPAGSPFGNFGGPKPDDAKKSDEKKDDKAAAPAPAPAFGTGVFGAASFAPKKDDAAPTAPVPAFGKVGSAFGATASAATPGKSAFGQPAQPPSVSPFPKTATAADAAPKPDQKATEEKTEKADSADAVKKTDQSGNAGMFSGSAFGGATTGVIGATGHSAFGQSNSGSAFEGQSTPATTSGFGTQSNTFGVKPPSGAAAFAQASSAPKAEAFNSPFTANEASKSGAPAAAFKSDFSKVPAIDPSKNVPVDAADETEEGQEEGHALEETYTAGVVEFQQSTAPRLSSFDEETNVITFFPGTPQESTDNAPGYQRHMWSQSGQYCAVVFGDGSQLYEKQANGGMESIQLFDNVVLGFMTDNVLALWEHGDGTSTVITFVDFKGSVVLKSVNVTMGAVETGVAVASGVFLKAEDGWYSLQYSDDNTIDWAFMFEPDAELFSLEGLSILAVEENDANKMMLTVTNSDKPFQPCELPAAFVQAIDVNSNSWFQDAGCQLDFVCFKPCGGMVPFAVTCTELIERNFWELIKDCPGIAQSAPASAAVTPPQAPMHSPGKGLLPMPTQAPVQPQQQPQQQPQETSSTSSPTVPTAFLQPGFVKKVEEPAAASAHAPAQEEPAAATSSTPAASAPAPAAQPPKANGSAFGNANAFGGKSAFGGTAVAPGKSAFGAPSASPAAAPAFGTANAFGQPQGGAAGFSTAFANKSAPTATPSTFGSAFSKSVSPIPQTAMSAPSPAAATVASTTVTVATATPVPESVEQGSNLSTGKPSEANVRELIEQDEAGELAAVPDQMSKDDDDDAEAEMVKVDAAALARAKEREEEQALREAALEIELEATRAKLEAAEKQTILAREEAAEWRAKADSVMADLQATSSKMSKQIEDLMAELRVTKEKYQTHDAQTETVEKWEDFEEIKRGMREMATELAEFSAATTAEAGAPMQHIISRARMTINKRPFVAPAVPQRKPNEAPPSIAARAIGTR